jgi:signal transduction histidine kinase
MRTGPPRPAYGVLRGQASDDEYLGRLSAVLERQARAIGQSLHDEAGQLLSAVYLSLAEASRDQPALSERLLVVKRHLAALEEHLRHVGQELRPRLLDEVGLLAALDFLARGFAARHGISTDLQVRVPRRLPDPFSTALYRMTQEALTNIGRHARATRVRIRVVLKAKDVRCTIRDDGVGFDEAAVAGRGGALGLFGMRERLETLGGVLTIRSVRGAGTLLIATIPLDSQVQDPLQDRGFVV